MALPTTPGSPFSFFDENDERLFDQILHEASSTSSVKDDPSLEDFARLEDEIIQEISVKAGPAEADASSAEHEREQFNTLEGVGLLVEAESTLMQLEDKDAMQAEGEAEDAPRLGADGVQTENKAEAQASRSGSEPSLSSSRTKETSSWRSSDGGGTTGREGAPSLNERDVPVILAGGGTMSYDSQSATTDEESGDGNDVQMNTVVADSEGHSERQ